MNSNKTILGLTGYYCSGKSAVGEILKDKFGFYTIDVDKIGHIALEEREKEIIFAFGKEIVKNKKIDRKKLGALVFNNKKKILILNSLVHPLMTSKVEELIESTNEKKVCINAALLFQMNLDRLCSYILIVNSSFFNIIKRAKQRDNNSMYRIIKILSIQKKIFDINKTKNRADIFYVDNNKDLNHLENQIEFILSKKDLK